MKTEFRTEIGETVFNQKYRMHPGEDWADRAISVVGSVCFRHLRSSTQMAIIKAIREFKFLPGGRYLYYGGRRAQFYNNCYLLRAEEDTREEWAAVTQRAMSCLMTGGGIGVDYSRLRPAGRLLSRTGGVSSGPIPLMHVINEVGRNVMQGGSRRSAIYASLTHSHEDIHQFLIQKNWDHILIKGAQEPINDWFTVSNAKEWDFNFPAPLDMTNISVDYDDDWDPKGEVFRTNVLQAMMTGEPGFSFNFGDKRNETLRNACTEVTSEDDSDVCNLGSINMARIESIEEFRTMVRLGTLFLGCGLLESTLPYQKVYETRARNSRIGLGLMGIHEWLLQRGYGYEVTPELHQWLGEYRDVSISAGNSFCDEKGLERPKGYRAIAPTGTIGMLAGTTTGIEPIYAVAYKRRYLTNGTTWNHQYLVDPTARAIVQDTGVDPDNIATSISLATSLEGIEQRIKFQADVQEYVDHAISSTCNLPSWGSDGNNSGLVDAFASLISYYAPRLRGLTFYPDGSRGGQPITPVPFNLASGREGIVFDEGAIDVCDITGKGGSCGV